MSIGIETPSPSSAAFANGADRVTTVTFFTSFSASQKWEEAITLEALADRIATTSRPTKQTLPWLKLARFGDARTEQRSLRHDANVLAIAGVEADYDAELMPFDEAVEILTKAGVESIVYTSPSNAPGRPRWRVLCPLSEEAAPDRRKAFMGRLNGLLRGVLADESWTLSQSYYFGSVNNNPLHRVELIAGTPIDEHDELDEVWVGKRNTKPANGSSNGTPYSSGPLDEDAVLRQIIDGESYHTASMRLLGRWARAGVPLMAAEARLLGAFDAVFPVDRDARWESRRADTARAVDYVYGRAAQERDDADARPDPEPDMPPEPPPHPGPEHFEPNDEGGETRHQRGDGDQKPPPPLRVVDPRTLAGKLVPQREWLVEDWLPIGCLTLLSGVGGVGKSLLAQQLMTACAAEVPWCGLAAARVNSFALFAEDSEDELHRRQHALNKQLGMTYDDLGSVRWMSGLGLDNTLAHFDHTGRLLATKRYHDIIAAAEAHDARLLILDTAADVFGGEDINRRQVRQFATLLNNAALLLRAAVVLNFHPSVRGIVSGELDGGSTAWTNSCRSRLTLGRPKRDGDDPESEEIVLKRRKANYASAGEAIALRWAGGALLPINQVDAFAGFQRAACADVFLDLLTKLEREGRGVSEKPRAGNYAPSLFATRPDRQGHSKYDFTKAMEALFADGRIRVEEYGRPSGNGTKPTKIVMVKL